MLVLSRRPDEKILLPTVPIVIKVISSQAGLTRLGIDAPANVPILREELCRGAGAAPSGKPVPDGRHAVRHRLNNLNLGLAFLREQLAGGGAAVRQTLDDLEQELRALRRQLAAGAPHGGPGDPEAVLAGGAGV